MTAQPVSLEQMIAWLADAIRAESLQPGPTENYNPNTYRMLRAILLALLAERDEALEQRDWNVAANMKLIEEGGEQLLKIEALKRENERARVALAAINTAFENTEYSDKYSEDHFEAIRDIALAFLTGGGRVAK